MAKAGALGRQQARLDAMLAVFGQAAIEAAAPAAGERVGRRLRRGSLSSAGARSTGIVRDTN